MKDEQVKEIAKEALVEIAEENLKKFLEENPHLQEYQNEIDRLLDMSGNSNGRMAVLATMMQGKLLELQKNLIDLTGVLHGKV